MKSIKDWPKYINGKSEEWYVCRRLWKSFTYSCKSKKPSTCTDFLQAPEIPVWTWCFVRARSKKDSNREIKNKRAMWLSESKWANGECKSYLNGYYIKYKWSKHSNQQTFADG